MIAALIICYFIIGMIFTYLTKSKLRLDNRKSIIIGLLWPGYLMIALNTTIYKYIDYIAISALTIVLVSLPVLIVVWVAMQ